MAETETQNRSKGITCNAGPELTTLAEKFVRALRLPYVWGCVILALVFVEIPIILDMFFETPRLPILGPDILYLIVVFLMSVYFPLSVRFARARVLEAEAKLTTLLPGGEADYHEAFGRAVSFRGQVLLIIAIAALAIYIIVQMETLIALIVISICAAYIAFMLGSLIWFNLGCIIGLYRLGGKSLKFKAFREDSKLGTRPIGSLSLSLSGAYFAGVVILILFSAVSTNPQYQIPYLWTVYAVLILVGLVMLFLPLFRVHFRMVEEKTRQDLLIQSRFDCVSHDLKSGEVEDPLANIQKLLSLGMADRKLQAVSAWPFDTTLLGKLLVILLSVTAALIARYLWTVFVGQGSAPPF